MFVSYAVYACLRRSKRTRRYAQVGVSNWDSFQSRGALVNFDGNQNCDADVTCIGASKIRSVQPDRILVNAASGLELSASQMERTGLAHAHVRQRGSSGYGLLIRTTSPAGKPLLAVSVTFAFRTRRFAMGLCVMLKSLPKVAVGCHSSCLVAMLISGLPRVACNLGPGAHPRKIDVG